jgi:uncharacterized membrane protein
VADVRQWSSSATTCLSAHLAFGEATLTGMVLMLMVVYRPHWVATFDDALHQRALIRPVAAGSRATIDSARPRQIM